MKPITVWLREAIHKPLLFEFNHIEDGHIGTEEEYSFQELAPIGNKSQTRDWMKGTWLFYHKYLYDNKVVDGESMGYRCSPQNIDRVKIECTLPCMQRMPALIAKKKCKQCGYHGGKEKHSCIAHLKREINRLKTELINMRAVNY